MTATFGLGGFGLLIGPACPCRAMVTDDDELVIAHGEHEVARCTPGDRPASASPSWLAPGCAQFGEGGPTLSLEAGVRYEDVLRQVNIGAPDGPWSALGPGFVHDLPRGLVLVSAAPDDEDPLFELHLYGGLNEFIKFVKQVCPASALQFRPAPGQQLVARDHLHVQDAGGATRELAYTELTYEHEGVPWKKLFIAVPLRELTSMVVTAQARSTRANTLFRAAGQVAATMEPLGG